MLLAWSLTGLVIAVAWRLIVERPPSWLANDALEARLTRGRPGAAGRGAVRLGGGARATAETAHLRGLDLRQEKEHIVNITPPGTRKRAGTLNGPWREG